MFDQGGMLRELVKWDYELRDPVRLSFLAPTIVKTILQGREPAELTANRLMLHGKLALAWSEQQAQLAVG
jgi:hypothetical protein